MNSNCNFYSPDEDPTANDKPTSILGAWQEGWATFFSVYMQQELASAFPNLAHFGDESYSIHTTASSLAEQNVNDPVCDSYIGDACELLTAAVVYDLFDSDSSSEHFDRICVNPASLYPLIQGNTPASLSDLLEDLQNYVGLTVGEKMYMGDIPSHYKIAPLINYSSSQASQNPVINPSNPYVPTFTWKRQNNNAFTTNYYSLRFYDSHFNFLYQTSSMYSTSASLSMAIGESDWKNLINKDIILYCVVVGSETSHAPVTTYYSDVLKIDLSDYYSTYKLYNAESESYLTIQHTSSNSVVQNGTDVIIQNELPSSAFRKYQTWSVENYNASIYQNGNVNMAYANYYFKYKTDDTYGLNVHRSGNPYDCTMHELTESNSPDAKFEIIRADNNNIKIKWVGHSLYLTADAATVGANVSWSSSSSGGLQKWQLVVAP